MIPTYTPKISVTLKKVQRRLGEARIAFLSESRIPSIDLTPFLGEMGGVTTSRGIGQAAGTFAITLADKMDATSQDSLYAMIEPMDLIEIRMARIPGAAGLPLVMRGFVGHVARNQSMGQDGRPQRTVQVTGHDFGKLLQIMQISYQKEYVYGKFLLTSFPMFERYGLWFDYTASQFVSKVVNDYVSLYLTDLFEASGLNDFLDLKADATVKGARVGPFGMAHYEGDVWQLLENWGDLAWNEMFIEDRPDAAYLVYRPKPYYGLDGKLVMEDHGAIPPDVYRVGIDEVESISVSRSDQDVANFYQVDAPEAEMLSKETMRAQAAQNGWTLLSDYPNCTPDIYGLKKLAVRTNHAPDQAFPRTLQSSAGDKTVQAAVLGTWYGTRLDQIKRLSQDNVLYESGTIVMRGNEAILPGTYIRLMQGDSSSRYYVTHVSQQFMPFRAFKTTLQVSRGEGYIDRLKMTGSPYLAEGRKGAI